MPRETEAKSNRSEVRLNGSPVIIMHTNKSNKTAVPISVKIMKLFTSDVAAMCLCYAPHRLPPRTESRQRTVANWLVDLTGYTSIK